MEPVQVERFYFGLPRPCILCSVVRREQRDSEDPFPGQVGNSQLWNAWLRRLLLSVRKHFRNVAVEHEDHHHHQENEPELKHGFLHL